MSRLEKQWAGRIAGTNTGNIFLLLSSVETPLRGKFRLLDDKFGIVVYSITGDYTDELRLTGTPESQELSGEYGELTITGMINDRGEFQGRWESTIGTGGTYILYPHPEGTNKIGINTDPVPEQFYTHTISMGALTLYKNDVEKLISESVVDFEIARAIITYSGARPQVTLYASEFFANPPESHEIKNLKISVQEPDMHNINKVVNIQLDEFGQNSVLVQGVRESWVIGKATTIAACLKRNENVLVTSYKKFGLNLNQVIFFAMIVLMPSLPTLEARTAFGISVFIILSALYWVHSRFIPNTRVNLSVRKASLIERFWPTFVSFVVAAAASLAAALAFKALTE